MVRMNLHNNLIKTADFLGMTRDLCHS